MVVKSQYTQTDVFLSLVKNVKPSQDLSSIQFCATTTHFKKSSSVLQERHAVNIQL